jgi:hypothetical protein
MTSGMGYWAAFAYLDRIVATGPRRPAEEPGEPGRRLQTGSQAESVSFLNSPRPLGGAFLSGRRRNVADGAWRGAIGSRGAFSRLWPLPSAEIAKTTPRRLDGRPHFLWRQSVARHDEAHDGIAENFVQRRLAVAEV